ncbi:MAG: protein kinase [Thermoanaerobaculia bacterium]|nr:protein kinase [Thermoanaerobaculia bacterium]
MSPDPFSIGPGAGNEERSTFGRFEVRRVLGRGGMGTVYAAEDPLIGRRVAIKEIRIDHILDAAERSEMQERFKLEFRTAGTLAHPNVVTVYDVGTEDGAYYLAMEHVDGRSLADVLKDAGRMETERALDLARQIAAGLDYAHDHGIVHRDVKPANILLTSDGRPKITDFGLVKVMTSELTTTGTVLGTPAYMSPEQVVGESVDGKSDQFSFAVLLYAMLTGVQPFRAEHPSAILYLIVHERPRPPRELNPDLPPAVDKVLLRGLAKKPEERFPSCTALVDALKAALEGGPGQLPSPTDELDASLVQAAMARDAPGDSTRGVKPSPRLDETHLEGTVASLEITQVHTPTPTAAGTVRAYSAKRRMPQWPLLLLLVTVVGVTSFVLSRRSFDSPVSPGEQMETIDVPTGPVEPPAPEGDSADGAEAPSTTSTVAASDPAPQTFTVTSLPEGAAVTFDGTTLAQRTPVEIEIAPGGDHRLEVRLDGFDTASWSFRLDSLRLEQLEDKVLHFPLRSAVPPAKLWVDSSYPVTIVVDGRTLGPVTRGEVALPPSTRQLTLLAKDVFFRQTRRVAMESGKTLSVTTPRVARANIVATPGNCRVRIDGWDAGTSPINDLPITVGAHKLEFEWPTLGRKLTKTEVISPSGNNFFVQPN